MAESWVFNRKLVHNADTGKRYLRITCDATAAVAKTFTVTQMGDEGSGAPEEYDCTGWRLERVVYYFDGTTPVNDNTDLDLLEGSSSGRSIFLVAAAGASLGKDMLDSAVHNVIYAGVTNATYLAPIPIFDKLWISISGNDTASAVVHLHFYFVE